MFLNKKSKQKQLKKFDDLCADVVSIRQQNNELQEKIHNYEQHLHNKKCLHNKRCFFGMLFLYFAVTVAIFGFIELGLMIPKWSSESYLVALQTNQPDYVLGETGSAINNDTLKVTSFLAFKENWFILKVIPIIIAAFIVHHLPTNKETPDNHSNYLCLFNGFPLKVLNIGWTASITLFTIVLTVASL